jgi:hypothetical protein
MQLKADSKNTNLVNRSVPAAMAFVARVDQYLARLEQEPPELLTQTWSTFLLRGSAVL